MKTQRQGHGGKEVRKTALLFLPTLSTTLWGGEGTHYSHFMDAETKTPDGLQAHQDRDCAYNMYALYLGQCQQAHRKHSVLNGCMDRRNSTEMTGPNVCHASAVELGQALNFCHVGSSHSSGPQTPRTKSTLGPSLAHLSPSRPYRHLGF